MRFIGGGWGLSDNGCLSGPQGNFRGMKTTVVALSMCTHGTATEVATGWLVREPSVIRHSFSDGGCHVDKTDASWINICVVKKGYRDGVWRDFQCRTRNLTEIGADDWSVDEVSQMHSSGCVSAL